MMMTKVLVAYATKHESTAEIASAIGDVLRETPTFEVEVQSVEFVSDITPYGAVVLGSAVYVGQWQPSAVRFLKEHKQQLGQLPVWLFSSGPIGEGDPVAMMKGWTFPEALKAEAAYIKPRDITVFHGHLDPSDLNFLERSVMKMVKSPTGDFRDWEMIRGWATRIAQALVLIESQHPQSISD